jgi:hypothetical protein
MCPRWSASGYRRTRLLCILPRTEHIDTPLRVPAQVLGLAVADCLNSRPPPEVAEKLVGLLLKPTGLSVGDWHSLLVNALKSLEEFVVDGALSGNGRVLPELLGVFFRFRCFVGT